MAIVSVVAHCERLLVTSATHGGLEGTKSCLPTQQNAADVNIEAPRIGP